MDLIHGNILNYVTPNTIGGYFAAFHTRISFLINSIYLTESILWSVMIYIYFFKKNMDYDEIAFLFTLILLFDTVTSIFDIAHPFSINYMFFGIYFLTYIIVLVITLPFAIHFLKKVKKSQLKK